MRWAKVRCRKNSLPTWTTYINKFLLELENSRVPILLIGLSERSLLEGNRKLVIVITMILITYLIFEIVLIKGNVREKEMKEKQGNLKMEMRSNSCPNNLAFLLILWGQFCLTEIPVSFEFLSDYPDLIAQSFLMLWTISLLNSPKRFVAVILKLTRKGLMGAFMVEWNLAVIFPFWKLKCDPWPPRFQDLISCTTAMCYYTSKENKKKRARGKISQVTLLHVFKVL